MKPQNFFGELKRRNVYRVAVAYAVMGWLLIQIATQVFPFFDIPNWAVRLVVVVIALGFPIALILAWAFELTPEGIMRADEVSAEQAVGRGSGRKLDFFIIAVLLAAVALLVFDRWGRRDAAIAPDEKSIAVLPFQNLSRDPDNAFFTDGVQDEILTDLARVADLKVISRTSVLQYKSDRPRNLREIGQQLGVAHVLEGSVQRAGNRVRVNAQLVDARTDRHLWAQTYDRDLADVFAIQSEIAKSIARELRAKLSPVEKEAIERAPTNDVAAFDLYTRARKILERSATFNRTTELEEAVRLLNQATARDPSFFQAYCELAEAHDTFFNYGFDHTPARLALSEAAIQTAFRLRPDAGEAHLTNARHLYRGYLDYDRALSELEIARRTLPNDSRIFELIGYITRRKGHWDESTSSLERAIALDPRNVGILRQLLSANYHYFRRFAEAKATFERIVAIDPHDVSARIGAAGGVDVYRDGNPQPFCAAVEAERQAGTAAESFAGDALICAIDQRDGARAREILRTLGPDPIRFASDNVLFNRPFIDAIVARLEGDEAAAQRAFLAARAEQEKTLANQPDFAPGLCVLGLIDAALGRKEDALREGQRAVALLSPEKDAIQGTAMLKYLAIITAWAGDTDRACEQVAALLPRPSTINYGELKLLPLWDPLRKAACFEQLLEEAKKPVVMAK
jgi:TolB-like protein/Tfp pilus assembly protein PilF